jgi:hypothetical protein
MDTKVSDDTTMGTPPRLCKDLSSADYTHAPRIDHSVQDLHIEW